jgi:hypothetical protein
LAFHVGRVGHPGIAQKLLAPILAGSDPAEYRDAARAMYAVSCGSGQADTRLQIIGLETELAVLPADADDDRLRICCALASDYSQLGDYRRALQHGLQELPLRRRMQGADHPQTLNARQWIAFWTGYSGDPAEALRLSQELLPGQERVLGQNHPETLKTRNNIAYWTGQCGNPAEGTAPV